MQNIRTLYAVTTQARHSELSIARALSVATETGGASLAVIPPQKSMHGWTSQPWRPTVSFIVQGARRDMNIPAQAEIQFSAPGCRVSSGMTGCHTSGLGNGHFVSEQWSEEAQRETLHFVQGDNPGVPISCRLV